MSARVYFMKTVNGCKDASIMSLQDINSEDGQVYSVCTKNVRQGKSIAVVYTLCTY